MRERKEIEKLTKEIFNKYPEPNVLINRISIEVLLDIRRASTGTERDYERGD